MRSNKKGFTIVELVIVIAVIAILAAVLIPTIAGLVKKANLSSDKVAVRNMNTALATEANLADINAAIDALAKAGFNSEDTLVPVTAGHKFVWDIATKQVLLLDEKNAVVFPEKATLGADYEDLRGAAKYIDVAANDAKAFVDAINGGSLDITLTDDVTVDADITIKAGSNVVLDLGGNVYSTTALNAGVVAQSSKKITVEAGATLTIQNGTFNGRSVMNYGEIIIKEGTVINALDVNGGGCIRNKPGSKVTIEGGVFNVPNYIAWDEVNWGGAAGVYNDGGEVIINGGTFTSNTDAYLISNVNGAKMTINGGTFTAFRGALYASDSEVVVNGGSFEVTNDSNGGWVACQEGTGSITINGGTFTTVTNRKFNGNVIEK